MSGVTGGTGDDVSGLGLYGTITINQVFTEGSVIPPVGSPQVNSDLLVIGSISFSAYVALVYNGVQEGDRIPIAIQAGSWQAVVTPTRGGSYTVQLWTAAVGGTKLDETPAFVVVTPTSPPVVTSSQSFNVNETASISATVGVIAATGGTPTSWSITAGNTGTAFSINSSGVLSVAAALDFETLSLYTLTIQATNAGGSSSAQVVVSINNVLDVVPTITAGQNFNVSETASSGTVVGTVLSTGDAATSWSILSGNTGTAFAISSAGVITTAAALSFATLASYTLSIQATNAIGNSTAVNVGIAVQANTPSGTLTDITIEGTGAGASAITYFAQAFPQGDLPSGAAFVAAKVSDATKIRTQLTPYTYWPDGSVKHARIAIECPTLADTVTEAYNLVKNDSHASPGSNIDFTTGLVGRSASVTITPTNGGTPQTIDLLALVGATYWVQGPLYAEQRVTASINGSAVGGVALARLVADIILLKDGTLIVDFAVRNDAAFTTGTGTLQYGLTLTMDGQVRGSWTNIVQTVSKWFCRRRYSVSGGGAAVTRPYIRHNTAYIHQAGMVPNYDTDLGINATRITLLETYMAGSLWNTPLNNRIFAKDMGSTGDRMDIGVVPDWCAAWLLSYDRVTQEFGQDMAEAAMAIPWHYWDTTNSTWATTVNHPAIEANGSGFTPINGDTTWVVEQAHMPSASYVPWLLSGRRHSMDSLMAEASFAIFVTGLYARGNGTLNMTTADGVRLIGGGQQVRGQAWTMRSVGYAGHIVPPAEQPHGGYYRDAITANLNYINSQLTTWTAAQGEPYGYFIDFANGGGALTFPTWQHDFVFKVISQLSLMGYSGASTVAEWVANNAVGKYLTDPAKFHHADGIRYSAFSVGTNGASGVGPWRQTWAEIGANLQGTTLGVDPATMENNVYAISAAEAIATYVAARPQDARGARAWHWVNALNNLPFPEGSNVQLQQISNKHNVMPPGQSRATAAAPVVKASQTYTVLETLAVGADGPVVLTTGFPATSFAIVSGNTNSDWTIDSSGVLIPANALSSGTTASYTLGIQATNASGTSATGTVTLTISATAPIAPTVTSGLAFAVAQSATQYTVAGTATASAGTAPLTWSITAGNSASSWEINASTGVIRQALTSVDWTTYPSFSLTVQASNSAGSDTDTVAITYLAAPVITPSQTFDIVYSSTNGTSAGTVAATGTPTSWSITAGNTGNVFAISNAGVLTKQGTLTVGQSFTLTIVATNAYGSDSDTVTVNATDVPAVTYDAPNTTFLAVHGLRKIVASWAGSAIRVRRSSDNAEQDIGFSAGQLDESALTAFVGANTGYVTTRYDQSGRGMHEVQTTAALQPTITNSSGVIHRMGGTNSRPAILFTNAAGGGLATTSFNIGGTTSTFGAMQAFQSVTSSDQRRIFSYSDALTDSDSSGAGNFHISQYGASRAIFTVFDGGDQANTANESAPLNTALVASVLATPSTVNLRLNTTNTSNTRSSPQSMVASGAAKTGFFRTDNPIAFDGYVAETCIFGASDTTDQAAINANVMAWLGT